MTKDEKMARDYARARQKSLHLSQKDTNLIQLACLHGIEIGRQSEQLIEAKELLKRWVELYKPKLEGYPITPIQEQTEQFLNENGTYERILKAKYNYVD